MKGFFVKLVLIAMLVVGTYFGAQWLEVNQGLAKDFTMADVYAAIVTTAGTIAIVQAKGKKKA